jgi:hypothetical protein
VRWGLACLRVVGSLYIALGLLLVLTLVLAWATLLDQSYGEAAARFGVYGSWWFTVLGFLLAANILAALLVRLPWKRSQLGFVVAHAGLLVLLLGSLVTRQRGVEAMLALFEHRSASLAYQDSQHFELQVLKQGEPKPDAGQQDPIRVPFQPGPFNWDDYERLGWFPWRLAHRDQGVLYDRDGIRLEVVDYCANSEVSAQSSAGASSADVVVRPLPPDKMGGSLHKRQVRVRLTVDDATEEFWLGNSSDDPMERFRAPVPPNLRKVVGGIGRSVAITLRPDQLDLGVEVKLHEAQQRLDPGSSRPSHYSSRVDFLALAGESDSARRAGLPLRDVTIKMNSPADVTDPRTGRSYRLFQSGMQPAFSVQMLGLQPVDEIEGPIHASYLSVNYDPGRMLKNAGCLLIVLGVFLRYYVRTSRQRQP